ncbi:DUF1499 domain-containing protein [Rhodohalobacter sp. 8-1]|uniref:DUF1499 domain-containing protein n=1 Tax=Rhodohalobacter sp. 8-1 TaxID=3131972 RepID=UPI0030EDB0CE
MSTKWIIYGLLALALLITLNLVGPLKGTTPSDFPDEFRPVDSNPIQPCPDSPNCVRLSVPLNIDPDKLMTTCETILNNMGAEEVESDSESFQIDAVFRIALFGFRDDFTIRISPDNTGGSILHLSSRSRTGKGDLGVNRRRVQKLLSSIQSVT